MNYTQMDIYRGDIDNDVIKHISFREFALDLHIKYGDTDYVHKLIIDMAIDNGSIFGKMIYGLSYESVLRKLKDIREEK